MGDLSAILKRMAARTNGDGPRPPSIEKPDDSGDRCKLCQGRGWVSPSAPVGSPEFGTITPCECQEARIENERYDRLLKYSNVGGLVRFRFENLERDGLSGSESKKALFNKAWDAARSYADAPKGWLTFVGPTGSGKTHLAVAIANHCIENDQVVFFSHAPDLLDHLRSSFGPASDISYSDLFEQVRTVPILILDGLGSHSATPWAEEKLRQILNHRYNAELPTVVTTASPLHEIDPYIRTRVEGMGEVIELGAQGDDDSLQGLGRIPKHILERMTFETFDTAPSGLTDVQRATLSVAYEASKAFAESPPDGWIVLVGPTGSGKTHLAVAVAERMERAGRAVIFTSVPDLINEIRGMASGSSGAYSDGLGRVKRAPILILDDLRRSLREEEDGRGKRVQILTWVGGSAWSQEQLYHIIAHRHFHRLPTVITSPEDFSQHGGPIGSRIQDPTISQIIEIDSTDYRRGR